MISPNLPYDRQVGFTYRRGPCAWLGPCPWLPGPEINPAFENGVVEFSAKTEGHVGEKGILAESSAGEVRMQAEGRTSEFGLSPKAVLVNMLDSPKVASAKLASGPKTAQSKRAHSRHLHCEKSALSPNSNPVKSIFPWALWKNRCERRSRARLYWPDCVAIRSIHFCPLPQGRERRLDRIFRTYGSIVRLEPLPLAISLATSSVYPSLNAIAPRRRRQMGPPGVSEAKSREKRT